MTKLEHQGVKGMKWGKRKSYDKVGHMPGKIEKNRNKRLEEKRKNLNEIRRIKNDKNKADSLNDIRKRNDEITNINNKADYRLPRSKRNIRLLKNAGGLAVSASAMYLSTPKGKEKLAKAANRVKDMYDFKNPNVTRIRR